MTNPQKPFGPERLAELYKEAASDRQKKIDKINADIAELEERKKDVGEDERARISEEIFNLQDKLIRLNTEQGMLVEGASAEENRAEGERVQPAIDAKLDSLRKKGYLDK